MATEDDAACIICLKTEDELLNLGPKIQKGNITVHFYCLVSVHTEKLELKCLKESLYNVFFHLLSLEI